MGNHSVYTNPLVAKCQHPIFDKMSTQNLILVTKCQHNLWQNIFINPIITAKWEPQNLTNPFSASKWELVSKCE